jgi:hypothetical protein
LPKNKAASLVRIGPKRMSLASSSTAAPCRKKADDPNPVAKSR